MLSGFFFSGCDGLFVGSLFHHFPGVFQHLHVHVTLLGGGYTGDLGQVRTGKTMLIAKFKRGIYSLFLHGSFSSSFLHTTFNKWTIFWKLRVNCAKKNTRKYAPKNHSSYKGVFQYLHVHFTLLGRGCTGDLGQVRTGNTVNIHYASKTANTFRDQFSLLEKYQFY